MYVHTCILQEAAAVTVYILCMILRALQGAAAVYLAFAVTLADGKLHLPPTASPEYPYPHGPTNDTHYDLALFQWCLRTLLQIDEEYRWAGWLSNEEYRLTYGRHIFVMHICTVWFEEE